MAICCTCNGIQACPCACHTPRKVTVGRTAGWQATGPWLKETKTPGPGYWLARYAVNPPEGALVDGDVIETPVYIVQSGTLYVWGFSDVPEYGGRAYRTLGSRLDVWQGHHPDVTFVPDRDRTRDAPEASLCSDAPEPKPGFTLARNTLRDEARKRRERARAVRAAKETILAEYGPAGLERLERADHEFDGTTLDEWAKKLDEESGEFMRAANALEPS